jgi:site-specific DNA-methyltransferase (adenine-specific)
MEAIVEKIESQGITLIQGDALETLMGMEGETFDAVVTDPPYSSGGMHAGARQRPPEEKYQSSGVKKHYPALLGDNRDQRSFALWATLWLAQCYRVAKPGAGMLVFTDWRQLPTMTDAVQAGGWLWRGLVVWDKPTARPMLGEFRRQCEFLVFGAKGQLTQAHRKCLPGLYRHIVVGAAKRHITEKPLGLMEDLLQVVREGGHVLDPFMGSGSTGEACLLSGRAFTGIELSEEYFQVAHARLETAARRAHARCNQNAKDVGGQ